MKEIIKSKTASFADYRVNKIIKDVPSVSAVSEAYKLTYYTVCQLYDQGVNTFVMGLVDVFELLAAEAVIWAREDRPDIKLIIVTPYKRFSRSGLMVDQCRYNSILKRADDKIIVSSERTPDAIQKMHKYLMSNSSKHVCYCDGINDEIKESINSAKEHGLEIINICHNYHI